MTREQTLLAAFAAGTVAVFSAVMALTGTPAMWWTVVVMIMLLVAFISRLRRERKELHSLGPAAERIDEAHS